MTETEKLLSTALSYMKARTATTEETKLIRALYQHINFWPDDGGLKEPVREFSESFNPWDMIREHFGVKKNN